MFRLCVNKCCGMPCAAASSVSASRHPQAKRTTHAAKPRHACELEVALFAVVQLEDRFILPQPGFVNPPQYSVPICPACTTINLRRIH